MTIGTVFRMSSCSETSNMASSQKWQAQHKEQVFLIRNYCESTAESWGGLMRMEVRKKRNRLIAGVSTRLEIKQNQSFYTWLQIKIQFLQIVVMNY